MKTIQSSTRWLGLTLACSSIIFAVSTSAKKPPKPPPEPPPAAAYDLVLLGNPGSDSHAIDINDSGLVVGSESHYSPDNYYTHATLVVPEVEDGTLVWREDVDSDGRNNLLVDLGTAAGATQDSGPCNINDDGVILGGSSRPIPDTEATVAFSWILAPQVVDGRLMWADLDANRVNRLIVPLPVVMTDDPSFQVKPQRVNNHGEVALVVEWFDNVTWERWQRGFLLIPNRYEVAADGAVTIEYPVADLDDDGLNDYLIDLGAGVRVQDGAVRPLNVTVINDHGDVAGKVWNDWLGEVNGERPFVLRPRADGNGDLIWNEDNDDDGLNDLAVYLPLPAEVIAEAPYWSDISQINDMNENGTIIGTVYYGSPKGSRGAIWQVDWVAGTVSYTELGLLNRQYDVTDPRAVNAGGQVVGRSLRYTKNAVYQKGWLWEQGNIVPLGDLVSPETGLADISSVAVGINDSGMIVGVQQSVYPGNWTAFIAVPVQEP